MSEEEKSPSKGWTAKPLEFTPVNETLLNFIRHVKTFRESENKTPLYYKIEGCIVTSDIIDGIAYFILSNKNK